MSEKFAYHYSTFNFAAQLSLHVYTSNKIHDLQVVAPQIEKIILASSFF